VDGALGPIGDTAMGVPLQIPRIQLPLSSRVGGVEQALGTVSSPRREGHPRRAESPPPRGFGRSHGAHDIEQSPAKIGPPCGGPSWLPPRSPSSSARAALEPPSPLRAPRSPSPPCRHRLRRWCRGGPPCRR